MNFETRDFFFADENEPIVIAEIGVNHNGDLALAKLLIDTAQDSKADVVKFQAFKSEKEISKYASKAKYQIENTGNNENQLDMCKALELSQDNLREIKNYCDSINMPFLISVFDYDSLDFVVDELKVHTLKIASSEVTNIPFLECIGSKKKSVILSTGASKLYEVGIAIETLQKTGSEDILIFHCISNYPAPYDQVNLKVIEMMKKAFGLPVGFSDHTSGIYAAIASIPMGAVAIEKHFTLDRNMEGPDHKASIEPNELTELVKGVKFAKQAIGSSIKKPVPCEYDNINLIRKSLVAAYDLEKGFKLSRDMIEIKRPQGGIEPCDMDKIIGLTLKNNIEQDKPINWEDIA